MNELAGVLQDYDLVETYDNYEIMSGACAR